MATGDGGGSSGTYHSVCGEAVEYGHGVFNYTHLNYISLLELVNDRKLVFYGIVLGYCLVI